jgi:hypothetical protein
LCAGEGHEASEEENSGDDEHDHHDTAARPQPKKRHKKAKSGQAKKLFARGGFTEAVSTDWQKDLHTEQKQREEEKEKKKAEDIWAGIYKTIIKAVVPLLSPPRWFPDCFSLQ